MTKSPNRGSDYTRLYWFLVLRIQYKCILKKVQLLNLTTKLFMYLSYTNNFELIYFIIYDQKCR